MELLSHLATGFGVAFTPVNLLYAFIGCMLGTLIGVLPGIGPVATIAMLLPTTYALQPVSALIMLAGIYYGAQYGGSTTAVLLNMPGESSSVVTCLDGHQMARKGQAGAALAIAALGSFFRRYGGHDADRQRGGAPVGARSQVRARGILLAHGAGSHRRRSCSRAARSSRRSR
jgi:TctA family transporter